MNKSELIQHIADEHELSRAQAMRIVNSMFDPNTGVIAKALKKGDSVSITGFGNFEQRARRPHVPQPADGRAREGEGEQGPGVPRRRDAQGHRPRYRQGQVSRAAAARRPHLGGTSTRPAREIVMNARSATADRAFALWGCRSVMRSGADGVASVARRGTGRAPRRGAPAVPLGSIAFIHGRE